MVYLPEPVYTIADFCRDHKRILVGTLVVLAALIVTVTLLFGSSSPRPLPATAVIAQGGRCGTAVAAVESFVTAHPTHAGPLSPSARNTFNSLDQQVQQACPPIINAQLSARVLAPWLPTALGH